MRETGSNRVFLDLSPIDPERIKLRFPRILDKLKGFGIDILRDPIPVRPSAHYSIGGVRTNAQARTSVEGLFAAGEVAATGLHGANRLASNSLLITSVSSAASAVCGSGPKPDGPDSSAPATISTSSEQSFTVSENE